MKKKISLFLAFLMIFSVIPLGVYAEDNNVIALYENENSQNALGTYSSLDEAAASEHWATATIIELSGNGIVDLNLGPGGPLTLSDSPDIEKPLNRTFVAAPNSDPRLRLYVDSGGNEIGFSPLYNGGINFLVSCIIDMDTKANTVSQIMIRDCRFGSEDQPISITVKNGGYFGYAVSTESNYIHAVITAEEGSAFGITSQYAVLGDSAMVISKGGTVQVSTADECRQFQSTDDGTTYYATDEYMNSLKQKDLAELSPVERDAITSYNTYLENQGGETWTSTAKLYSRSITLGGEIGVNFYMEMATPPSEDTKMWFTVEGESGNHIAVQNGTKTVGDKTVYGFTCKLNAKQMNKKITAQLYDKSSPVSEEYTYSIKEYVDNICAGDFHENIKDVARKLLVYGSAAQVALDTGVDVNQLPDPDYKTKLNTEPIAAEEHAYLDENYPAATTVTAADAEISCYGSSVSLGALIDINHYLEVASGVDPKNYTYIIDGTYAVEPQWNENEGRHCVKIEGIPAHKLGHKYKLEIKQGDTVVSTTEYAVYNYVNVALDSGNAALVDVVTSIFRYGQAVDLIK